MWLKQISDDRLILATVYRSHATELYSVEKVAEKGVISSHRDVQRGEGRYLDRGVVKN